MSKDTACLETLEHAYTWRVIATYFWAVPLIVVWTYLAKCFTLDYPEMLETAATVRIVVCYCCLIAIKLFTQQSES
jgi:hypothetical protein